MHIVLVAKWILLPSGDEVHALYGKCITAKTKIFVFSVTQLVNRFKSSSQLPSQIALNLQRIILDPQSYISANM